ncbi:septal ring lytic transglycosylase RlpA family protein [Aliidiomarina sedimenti]|uniref:septal ring lytic transglycosylase RlpA family protein n=1 Tax=Aliidiomarina sedimenti TaxID=1933879 RepID=UPI003083FAD6
MPMNARIKPQFLSLSLLAVALLSACSSQQGRYSMRYDEAPERLPSVAEINPLEPRYEPLSRQGNMSSYTVLGETYRVLPSAEGYSATGLASWYGKKFHGHLTSNGEYYDMYGLSAAHRYLPLPTYARVTNLRNGKEIIVRINDRGPFHPERIIDLSYAAAYKLDMLDSGVTEVQVEALYMPPPTVVADSSSVFIQIAALSDSNRIQQVQQELQDKYALNATTRQRDGLHRLLLGPFDESQASQWVQRLRQDGFDNAFRVAE